MGMESAYVPAALAVLGIIFVLFRIAWRLLFNPLRHIPGPWKTRVTDFDLAMHAVKGARVYKLEELHARYGSVVRVGPNEVSISDWTWLRPIYANNKAILKEKKFYGSATFIGKNNIFQMLNPAEHAGRRKLSSSSYSMQSVSRLDPIIKEKAEALARRLLLIASTSGTGTADAYELCGLYSFEVVCKAGFAKEFSSTSVDDGAARLLKAMDSSALTLIFDQAAPFLSSWGLGSKLPGFVGDSYRNMDYWRDKSREMVDHFLMNSKVDDKFLLSPLSNNVDNFLGRKLTHDELVEEAMGYMFAGSGTTSSTLTYLLYSISRPENMHIQSRLRDEVSSIFSAATTSVEDISAVRKNPYINAVIKEVFRLYPTIISTLPRVLAEPMVIDKYALPAGTVVGMQNWIHHRDPTVFPDPHKFIPDRWLKSTEAMDLSLTPFSIGKRNCIGQNLAWRELYWAIVCIMQAGLETRVGSEMKDGDMHQEDRFNTAPRGRRLMLEVTRVAFKQAD